MVASTASYTLRNGLMRYGNKAKKAILDELQGILDRHVWDPHHDHELTRQQKKNPLHAKWVITPKVTPEGVFEKVKVRSADITNAYLQGKPLDRIILYRILLAVSLRKEYQMEQS